MKRKYWGILGKWLVTWQQEEFKADCCLLHKNLCPSLPSADSVHTERTIDF